MQVKDFQHPDIQRAIQALHLWQSMWESWEALFTSKKFNRALLKRISKKMLACSEVLLCRVNAVIHNSLNSGVFFVENKPRLTLHTAKAVGFLLQR